MFHLITSSHPSIDRHYVVAADSQGLVWVKSKAAGLKFSGFEAAKEWLKAHKHSGIGTTILLSGERVIL